ncbi:MAG: PilT/PilU family type 4a pilus ATPase [Defluviitaleaceae bacterium]|nr:PilT/PilU family type 4a pilus ATPase [Defluviitaleaceae bacterium]MCL2262162.1 PilT/PilU family type 4a pilus ATPase [Defluviitaleaceae bacterium]
MSGLEERILLYLRKAAEHNASDIYIIAGKAVTIKVSGRMVPCDDKILSADDSLALVGEVYRLNNRKIERLDGGDDDFAIGIEGIGRFRVNAYRQRFSCAAVLRTIPRALPDPNKINIPEVIVNLASNQRGLVLFTGTTGSGKTTSLACLVDRINSTRDNHIVTIEDPIEFRHPHKKSIISQRELDNDTKSYLAALRAALRQAPDVILVGEMRDHETIAAAVTAAETGHLVFSTLHTIGAGATIDRIIDVFPPNQQNQVRTQLAITLCAIVSQQLVPTVDGKLHPAYEIMICNSALRNLIREGKTFQIDNVLQTSVNTGMRTMDMSLADLCKRRVITRETALTYSVNYQDMLNRLSGA